MGRRSPLQTLILRPMAWGEEAALFLTRIGATDPTISLEWFHRQVETDNLMIEGVWADEELIGAIFWRVETGDRGQEFVIVAASGELPGVDLIRSVLPTFETMARRAGTAFIRVHTARPGLVRRLGSMGYRPEEVVLRKAVVNVA